ncbi:hypothetical protein [uncultured Eubacterium sp.]|uniref:hypothetical protein n=1 Tax=uncultured Eubacterium sp. TaxID=165185 RepID=UPI0025F788B9|nr:hypothetical protein [uncultured Eubacterium sp.]
MRFEKYNKKIKYLYHYTTKENAEKILAEKTVKTGNDRFAFFADSFENAKLLFSELMEKKIRYVDDDLSVKVRAPQSSEDYVVLKIRADNDSAFYRFVLSTDKFNPYDFSILHLGDLHFSKATVLPLTHTEENSQLRARFIPIPAVFNCKRLAAGLAAAIIGMSSITAFAAPKPIASWIDSGMYDASWYNSEQDSFNLYSAEEIAGISYLSNNGETFEGKKIIINNDIDLSANNWVSLPSSFKGTIEGAHKIVLTLFSNEVKFAENIDQFTDIEFKYVEESTSTQISYSVAPTYTITIPATVELGDTAEIKAENVVVEKGSQVEVKLTDTSEDDNSFKLKSNEGAELAYTINNGTNDISVGDTVLAVNPDNSDTGTANLSFFKQGNEAYAGAYKGTVTFTVSIEEVI